MENAYLLLKKKHQQEFNEFPMFFAFSDKQFKEGMATLGLKENETDKIFSIGNGGFYRKSDAPAFHEMLIRHDREMQEAIDNDATGDGFIREMFEYELANHEYGYTMSLEDTLNALDLTYEEIEANEKLLHGLRLATKKF